MEIQITKKLLFLFSLMLFVSCNSDNDRNSSMRSATPGDTDTEFVIGPDAFVTVNAYMLLNDAAGGHER